MRLNASNTFMAKCDLLIILDMGQRQNVLILSVLTDCSKQGLQTRFMNVEKLLYEFIAAIGIVDVKLDHISSF